MRFIEITPAMLQDKSPTNIAPEMALQDVKEFYDERPDCGDMETAIELVQKGAYRLGCFLDEKGGYHGMELIMPIRDTLHVEAHRGRLSDYTACALALEEWAIASLPAVKYIQTDTKPSYAVVSGKLGYDLASFKWRKNIREQ